jgi:hypothetical protein
MALDRSEIGPTTDLKLAALALTKYYWRKEGEAFADIGRLVVAWQDGMADGVSMRKYGSIKSARRAMAKARQRMEAAHHLYTLAEADARGALYILRTMGADNSQDAPQSPLVNSGETESPNVASDATASNTGSPDEDTADLLARAEAAIVSAQGGYASADEMAVVSEREWDKMFKGFGLTPS